MPIQSVSTCGAELDAGGSEEEAPAELAPGREAEAPGRLPSALLPEESAWREEAAAEEGAAPDEDEAGSPQEARVIAAKTLSIRRADLRFFI